LKHNRAETALLQGLIRSFDFDLNPWVVEHWKSEPDKRGACLRA